MAIPEQEDYENRRVAPAVNYFSGVRYVKHEDVMKWTYCQLAGADSITGLDSCDDYKDWLSALRDNT